MNLSREDLIRRIAEEEARLSSLERQRHEARKEIAALRDQLEELAPTIAADAAGDIGAAAPPTSAEKVRLFRSLFRGRADVFPIRFVSKKTGRPGYAPACANKFVRGVCELPRIKCGECPNQAFQSVDDRAILNHLKGHHVMGVYPLLGDETCWFLAADFDKASWQDDVAALVGTCRGTGVPVSVERSRSGNGAHAWFFFAEPVASNVARRMGCYPHAQVRSTRILHVDEGARPTHPELHRALERQPNSVCLDENAGRDHSQGRQAESLT